MANIKVISNEVLSERGIKFQNDDTRSEGYGADPYADISVPADYEVPNLDGVDGVYWHFGSIHIPAQYAGSLPAPR